MLLGMAWGVAPDLAAIAGGVRARLDGGALTGEPWRLKVTGAWRGRQVLFFCSRMRSAYEWIVNIDVDGPPLSLCVCRKVPGEQALIGRGVLSAVPTGDAEFDAQWTLKGAPSKTILRLVDASLREALVALGQAMAASGEGAVHRNADRPLEVEAGSIKVGSQLHFGMDAVMAGLELAARAANRLDAIARDRAASPPSAEDLAAEQREMTVTRETFLGWLKARMSPPLWALAAVLLVVTWISNNLSGHEAAGMVVAAVDFVAFLVPFVLWRRSRRERLGA
jgi:hypothetical protein